MSSLPGAVRAVRAAPRLASTAVCAVLLMSVAAHAAPVSLADALTRASAQNLNRPAAQARVDAAEAAARQAGVRPNPTVGLDVENLGWGDDRQNVYTTEATLYYEQTLERSAKREARVAAARAEAPIAQLRGQAKALDVLAQVQQLWVEAAAAEASLAVAHERLDLAERLQRETARRVSAARDPLFAGERARTGVLQAQTALAHAEATVVAARAGLAAYLGLADVEVDPSALNVADGVAAAAPPEAAVQTVDLALLEAERDAAQARIRREETRALQDPSVRTGLRYFQWGGDVALMPDFINWKTAVDCQISNLICISNIYYIPVRLIERIAH